MVFEMFSRLRNKFIAFGRRIISKIKVFVDVNFSKIIAVQLVFFFVAVLRYLSVEVANALLTLVPDYGFFVSTTINSYKQREVTRYVMTCIAMFIGYLLLTEKKRTYVRKQRPVIEYWLYLLIQLAGIVGVNHYNSHFTGQMFWITTVATSLWMVFGWLRYYRLKA